MADDVTVWFNPSCSKSRGTRDLLDQRGVDARYFRYLDEAPSRDELERVLRRLGTDDPMTIVRTGEATWKDLGVDPTDRDAVLDALASHPVLIERPIAIRGDRAVIGRPPERVLELLDDGSDRPPPADAGT